MTIERWGNYFVQGASASLRAFVAIRYAAPGSTVSSDPDGDMRAVSTTHSERNICSSDVLASSRAAVRATGSGGSAPGGPAAATSYPSGAGEGSRIVGENRRYDRSDRIDAATDAEVRALRIIAEIVGQGTRLVIDRADAQQVEEVPRAVATEFGNGRPVPLPVRRAVRHLADAIRAALDPRSGTDDQSGSRPMRSPGRG